MANGSLLQLRALLHPLDRSLRRAIFIRRSHELGTPPTFPTQHLRPPSPLHFQDSRCSDIRSVELALTCSPDLLCRPSKYTHSPLL